ncbi:hypothetical protein J546_2299 [Acinetobacter sp. 1461402]|nr:hypothetical protein J546_2299 [Acinetobacter sp. 1461402]
MNAMNTLFNYSTQPQGTPLKKKKSGCSRLFGMFASTLKN